MSEYARNFESEDEHGLRHGVDRYDVVSSWAWWGNDYISVTKRSAIVAEMLVSARRVQYREIIGGKRRVF